MNLDHIQSAELIEDPIKILNCLNDAREQTPDDTSTVICDDDGRARVNKRDSNAFVAGVNYVPDVATIQQLAESIGLEWQSVFASRVIPYIASDERVDRHGDIVVQNWKFHNFEKNPIVPYGHDWDMPPVGNCIKWGVHDYTAKDYSGPGLHLLNLFATKEIWPWADTVFRLVKSGFLKSSSVGFYPGVIIDVKDTDERAALGLGKYGYLLDENELIEHSVVSVPANAGAVSLLRSAKSKGLVQPQDIIAIRELARKDAKNAKEWRIVDTKWVTVWGAVCPEVEVPMHNDFEIPIALESLAKSSQLSDLVASVNSLADKIKGNDDKLQDVIDELALSSEIRALTASIEENLQSENGIYSSLFDSDIPTLNLSTPKETPNG
ncbi:MAG: hypothetical protein COA69_09430 [Robiginitomaculum sp.]|nr:MAG: hypothetical protein COA69_09430 [Robiginitomaculum sp.]